MILYVIIHYILHNLSLALDLSPEDTAEINSLKILQNKEDEVYCAQLEKELQTLSNIFCW